MKAILVIDMPSSCSKCDFCEHQYEGWLWCNRCKKTARAFDRPDWCPLRPAPEKRHTTDDFMEMLFNVSRNICIDEFMGNITIPLQVGNVISCDSVEELIGNKRSLKERGIITDYLYEKDGQKGLWLEVKEIKE